MYNYVLGWGGRPQLELKMESANTRKFEYYSFWKPEPLPPRDSKIHTVDLQPLGTLDVVAQKLTEVPNLAQVPKSPWEVQDEHPTLRFQWQVEAGVILRVRAEQGPPAPGEVLTIGAACAAPQKDFFRLYVQIYEQFGVTVFDERLQDFLTPREFKLRVAG